VATYADYCPIAVATELVGDRWSVLILREIMVGSTRFNDIHRGIPRISRTLLSQRLRVLVRDGLVERRSRPGRSSFDYVLTEAGRDLQPIVWELGKWSTRWAFTEPTDEQLDVAHLVWRLHQVVDPTRVPRKRTTVEFQARGPGGGRAWLVFENGESTACELDPGYEVDLVVNGENRELHRWYVGRVTWREACRDGGVSLVGPARLAREFPRWFRPSAFHADVRAVVTGRRPRGPVAGVPAG
jgi:DNA-binding HxlR family transcriptional regulator